MPLCPNGHNSTLDDFCSDCGTKMDPGSAPVAPAASAAAPGTPGPTCSNCNEPHLPDDVFCESCGYDFLSGSLPDPSLAPTTSGAVAAAEAAGVDPDAPSVRTPAQSEAAASAVAQHQGAPKAIAICTIQVSREFYDRMGAEGSVEFPDPVPPPATIELRSEQALIGRLSESRGVFPNVDVSLSQDPAASTKHAMLHYTDDGHWTVTDLESTNGTYLDDAADPLAPNAATPIEADTVIFVGAWTQITLSPPA